MKEIRIYPKLELLNTWAIDRTRFSPDATKPPLCLRCGQPLAPVLTQNALSRHADVYICDACGTDEALCDAIGFPKRFILWDAVENQRLKAPADDDAWLLKPLCSFDQIPRQNLMHPKKHGTKNRVPIPCFQSRCSLAHRIGNR